MTVMIESGERLGLRALGSGGRIAVASYDQLARTLRDLLGADHAALFAEPSFRGNVIDWFADLDTIAKPMPLQAASPELRVAGQRKLESLFGDITAKGEALRKSNDEAQRILGEMIGFALEVPDEGRVWLVGTQPVLTFWGHVKDHGRPPENPIRSVIQARPPVAVTPAPQADPPQTHGGTAVVPKVPPARFPSLGVAAIPAGVLWAIFAALLVAIGVMLLRACALGLPAGLTGWLLNSCPATLDASLNARLNEERAQQATLQAEYERLLRDAALKRQACMMKPREKDAAIVAPNVPIEPPHRPPEMTEPVAKPAAPPMHLDRSELTGKCWRADLGENIINSKTKAPISIVFCFNAGGGGRQIILEASGKVRCEGALAWTLAGDKLVTDLSSAKCSDNIIYREARVECRPNSSNEAVCTETYSNHPDGGWKGRKFLPIDAGSL